MRKVIVPFILFALSLAIFSFQADVIGLEFKGDENFYFQSSRQMVEKGDWITPYYFERPRFEKPILYYWLVATFFKISGISWRAARLPSAISMTLVVVLVYLFGLKFFNKRVGILSSLIVTTSIAIFRYARLVLPEAFFVLLLCGSIYLMLEKAYLWAYLLMGLAILTKGPVGLLLPLFIMAGYIYGIGEKSFFKETKFFSYFFIALLISLPWFLLMVKIHGRPYIEHVFLRETVQRIGSFELDPRSFIKTMVNCLKTLFYFVPVIFIFYLPWSLFLIPSIREASSSITKKDTYANGAVFSFVWFFAILIFFTFLGEKHRHYMLALLVPFGLMVGNYFYTLLISKKNLKALLLLIPAILSFFIFESVTLAMSKEIGGIGAIFLGKSYDIKEGDYVAIGSHSIVPQELEIYVNHPVERVYFKWPSREESDRETMNILNKEFFYRKNDSFLLIKKSDFLKYIWPETKKRLTILGKGYIYSKGAGPSEALKGLVSFDRKAFLDLFREEAFFVTNRKD